MEPQLSNALVCHVLGHILHQLYQVDTLVLKTEGIMADKYYQVENSILLWNTELPLNLVTFPLFYSFKINSIIIPLIYKFAISIGLEINLIMYF